MGLILPGGPRFSRYENNIQATPPGAGSLGVVVSHPGVAHTKNATWTQLIASSAFDAQVVLVTVSNSNVAGANSCTLLDIGIGAAAAETVLIPDLLAGWAQTTNIGVRHYFFPLYVPAGSRISARTASVRTTGSVSVLVELYGGPRSPDRWWCGQQVTAYGIDTAKSSGVTMTPGNSGAESSPVAVGTTSAAHECVVLGVQGAPGTTTMSALGYLFDVGIDTASTAWMAQDSFYAITATSEAIGPGGSIWFPFWNTVKSGSELVVAGECSGTGQALDFALYGVS